METRNIVNLLDSSENEFSKFTTKNGTLLTVNQKVIIRNYHDPIKCLTKSIESSLCDYSHAYILVTGNIESRDNYSDTLGSILRFKRDQVVNNANVTNDDDASSFNYKTELIAGTEANEMKNVVKIAVSLKYLINFWRSLEMPLINCKVELSLRWIESCALTTAATGATANATGADTATFKITDLKLYVLVVTLLTEDSAKLAKQLDEGFKRSVYWNKYKVTERTNREKNLREFSDSSYEGVKRLLVLAYDNTTGCNQVFIDSFKKCFLPRAKIESYNIEIDGRTFYDQSINDSIKQYNKGRKVSVR